jgi:hypothetical protein
MANANLAELAERIDGLIAEARTSSDKKRRTQCIETALAAACEMMTVVNRKVGKLIDRVLEELGLDETAAEISFKDVVSGNDSFAELASKEAMIAFLEACEPMMVSQQFLSKPRVREFIGAASETYERFMDQRVSASTLRTQFERLENFFCRPPYDGGGGGPLLDGGPNSGPSGARAERICTYLQTFAAIGSMIAQIIGLFTGASGAASQTGLTADQTRKVTLISLLSLSGFHNTIASSEELPAEAYAPEREEMRTA